MAAIVLLLRKRKIDREMDVAIRFGGECRLAVNGDVWPSRIKIVYELQSRKWVVII